MKKKKYVKYGSFFLFAGVVVLLRKKNFDFFFNLSPLVGISLLSVFEINKKINFDIMELLIKEEKKNKTNCSYSQIYKNFYYKM